MNVHSWLGCMHTTISRKVHVGKAEAVRKAVCGKKVEVKVVKVVP